jgi:GNAT superfamily N-acetyltransferase
VANDVRRIRAEEGDTLKTLRLAALCDAPDAFSQTLAAVRRKTDADWARDAARYASALTDACFLAEEGSQIIGMGGVFVADGHGELVAMWTRPDARRRGAARRIIDAVAAWCRQTGLSELRTGVVDGNAAAATLYERAGFVPTGEVRALADGRRLEVRLSRSLA